MAYFKQKTNQKSFLFTYTKSIHGKGVGSYDVIVISLDSVYRCHHLINKYSHQRNNRQNSYVFRLNHFFGLETPTLIQSTSLNKQTIILMKYLTAHASTFKPFFEDIKSSCYRRVLQQSETY